MVRQRPASTASVLVNTGLTAGNGLADQRLRHVHVRRRVRHRRARSPQILAAPQNYYFNVHTTLNGGGAIRGQLQ